MDRLAQVGGWLWLVWFPRMMGALAAALAVLGWVNGIRDFDWRTADSGTFTVMLAEVIGVAFAAYHTIHRMVSALLNPGDAAAVPMARAERAALSYSRATGRPLAGALPTTPDTTAHPSPRGRAAGYNPHDVGEPGPFADESDDRR